MKFAPIKIAESNADKIAAVLLGANGKSNTHTYSNFGEIEDVAARADKVLASMLPKKLHVGARYTSESGDKMPNAYKYSRHTTRVVIERRATAWFLVDASQSTAYREAGKDYMILTHEQDAEAVRRFRQQYSVADAA